MRKQNLLQALLILLIPAIGYSQNGYRKLELNPVSKTIHPEVSFMQDLPVIDGILDKNLDYLPIRKFNLVLKTQNDSIIPIVFRLGYGTSFLYVNIEIGAPKLTFRDRAYQNGDGFVITIAQPKPNGELADEFYDLACSAVNSTYNEWNRTIFWNYNVDKIFLPVSEDTKLEFSETNEKVSFELLLPWKEIKPMHPWISKSIGLNLVFAKATEKGVIYYSLVDEELNALSKRNYQLFAFEKPTIKGNIQTFASLCEGHIFPGDSIHLITATVSDEPIENEIEVYFKSGEGDIRGRTSETIQCNRGLTIDTLTLPTTLKADYGYSVNWKSLSNIHYYGNQGITVLSGFDQSLIKKRLETVRNKIALSSYQTIQFRTEELRKMIGELKIYETSLTERQGIVDLRNTLELAEKGIDTIANQRDFIRKAYVSKLDSTFQPYVVYLPRKLDMTGKYSLIVYLHGSERDEKEIQSLGPLIPEGCIGLGVFGRGTSNGFARDHAQEDIAEAIETLISEYPIDKNKILLAGFSMGGYGVYRTFYETPNKFRGLIVISGGPDLGENYAPGLSVPDFSQERYLGVFKNTPIFIFHGGKDLNVSYSKTLDLVAKLKKNGAMVEFVSEPESGHEFPRKETSILSYYNWVMKVLEK